MTTTMDVTTYANRFQANTTAIVALATNVSSQRAVWRPAPDAWSLLEVINHLYDEEREDFRTRLDLTLHSPDEPWPPIDPVAWVTERKYNQRDLATSVENFVQERKASQIWLSNLQRPDFSRHRTHPIAGTITAGDLLASWLAHDFLHLRQLSELHWQYHTETAAPYATGYAGPW